MANMKGDDCEMWGDPHRPFHAAGRPVIPRHQHSASNPSPNAALCPAALTPTIAILSYSCCRSPNCYPYFNPLGSNHNKISILLDLIGLLIPIHCRVHALPQNLKFCRGPFVSILTMATEACCTPAPPATNEYVGKEETLAGQKVYITGSLSSASAAVILICDVFGFNTPLLLKLADKVAAAGYLVLVPDVFQGDPFTGSFVTGEFKQWLGKHHPTGVALDMARSLVEAVKDKGIGAVGAAGFCWGAKTVACLGKERDVRAVVQLHPSFVEGSDYEEVVVPIAVLAAPTDGIEKYEELLASRTELKSFVKIFPDVRHGWTVRYDETDENAMEQANEAHQLMIDWFAKHL